MQNKDLTNVVRCKDCIHYDHDSAEDGYVYGYCTIIDAMFKSDGMYVDEEDWFCAFGKSKEAQDAD